MSHVRTSGPGAPRTVGADRAGRAERAGRAGRAGRGGRGASDGAGATPATLALSGAGVAFTTHTYVHDERATSFGLEAARELRVDPERVFKTLVLALDETRLGVAVLPVAERVDPKAAARLLGAKRATLADPAAAERSSGYVVGGISPFGQKRRLPTALDESASAQKTILVSGGRRGFDVEVAPGDLVRVLDAVVGPLTRTASEVPA